MTSKTRSSSRRQNRRRCIDGDRLAAARAARGWTQMDLAVKAGVSAGTVGKIELGDAGGTTATLIKFAEALGLPVSDLMPVDLRSAVESFGTVEPPRLYTPEEASPYLGGMSPTTLRRKAGAREFPCTKLGRDVLFSAANIAEIIALCNRPALPEPPPRRRKRRVESPS